MIINTDNKNTKVAVIGAGQMGSGIAQVFATSKYEVKIYDISEKIIPISRNRIKNSLTKLESKELLVESSEKIQQRISYQTNIEELTDCDIFIESAFEDFSIKENIFRKLSEILKPTSLIASNTSSYSITALSQLIPYSDRFIGFHFMNPPPLMELIEIIKGLYTSEKTFSFFWKLAKELGKIPVASKNSPGFILNRILIPMINEAIYALQERISTADQIDAAMKLGANHPIGPLALAVLI
ncbi:MAG: 3-hydroxybutyryl-CoA dehydrogenase [Alphaproteobacteria bacterium]|nr:3-hydroxybutyryl-CoA dehydrogenase [Alphaproteobacteria bacterium]